MEKSLLILKCGRDKSHADIFYLHLSLLSSIIERPVSSEEGAVNSPH